MSGQGRESEGGEKKGAPPFETAKGGAASRILALTARSQSGKG
jgi:hypothetical protein